MKINPGMEYFKHVKNLTEDKVKPLRAEIDKLEKQYA